jgi:ribonucleoside-diphosphate reductase alpha chain
MIYIKDKNYKELEVLNVATKGAEPTYDISVKRNHHYLTKGNVITHNSSIFANIVSGGIEPIFNYEYIRTVIVQNVPEHIKDKTPNWHVGEFNETDLFKFTKEGDEQILKGVDEFGFVYKIDKNRGLTKEVLCSDYGVRWLKSRNEWDATADYVVNTLSLTVDDHLNDLKGFAEYIDSSISKTINIPNDYAFNDFQNVYLDAYKSGTIKGITTYRSGTMTSVLSNIESDEEEIILDDVNIPDATNASMKTLKADGKKWYVTVVYGEDGKSPIALFVSTNAHEKNVTTNNAIEVLTDLALKKGIPEKHIEKTLEKIKLDNNATKLTRLISLLLRHGVLIKNIVFALETVDDVFVGSFVFAIRKFLSSYIKDGEKIKDKVCDNCGGQLIFSEGCSKCLACGNSKCG